MAKTIDFSKTVADLAAQYPEILNIMSGLGFKEITSPAALAVMGKVMTIPRGSKIKGIPMENIVAAFTAAGFEVINSGLEAAGESSASSAAAAVSKAPEATSSAGASTASGSATAAPDNFADTASVTVANASHNTTSSDASANAAPASLSNADATVTGREREAQLAEQAGQDKTTAEERTKLLEGYIKRLSGGEDLESVRGDFVANFATVSVHDITKAEQALINEGMPALEVQKLCDIHSALFHGKTESEVMKEENEEITRQNGGAGHPVDILYRENRAIETRLAFLQGTFRKDISPNGSENRNPAANNAQPSNNENHIPVANNDQPTGSGNHNLAANNAQPSDTEIRNLAERLFDVKNGLKAHFSKKEELLMPILYHYDVQGPMQVMWGVDDEISKEFSYIAKSLMVDPASYDAMKPRALAVIQREQEMIYKEEKILFPLAQEKFTQEEWYQVYRDMPEMGFAFLDPAKLPKWEAAEEWIREQEAKEADKAAAALPDGIIHLPTGDLNLAQLTAILDVLPMDLTYIDENDVTRFFTNKGKIFARPLSCLGRPVYECHPPLVVPIVKGMLDQFRKGEADHVERWIPNPDTPVRIVYHAVHDKDGRYLGTLEMVQSFKDVKIPGRE